MKIRMRGRMNGKFPSAMVFRIVEKRRKDVIYDSERNEYEVKNSTPKVPNGDVQSTKSANGEKSVTSEF